MAPAVSRARRSVSTAPGQMEHSGATYAVGKGEVFLLRDSRCMRFQPPGAVTVLKIGIPE